LEAATKNAAKKSKEPLDFAFSYIKVIIIKLNDNHLWQPRHQDVQPDHQGRAASRQENPLDKAAALHREDHSFPRQALKPGMCQRQTAGHNLSDL
jgi:hypothetical protein